MREDRTNKLQCLVASERKCAMGFSVLFAIEVIKTFLTKNEMEVLNFTDLAQNVHPDNFTYFNVLQGRL